MRPMEMRLPFMSSMDLMSGLVVTKNLPCDQ